MKIALLLMGFILVASYLYSRYANSSDPANFSKDLPYGPFTVRVKGQSYKNLNMNYHLVSQQKVSYGVLYKGKPVPFPGDLQNNTGLPFMWAVYALPGAPDPTLVAGSQSLYLIYEKDGVPVVEPLQQQSRDFASLQILDGPDGRPGPFTTVYAQSKSAETVALDSLEEGRYVLVSEHAVLDVQTRKIWPLNKDNNAVDNYSFPSPHGALAFSPDQKTIVFNGSFQSWNARDEDLPDSEHALIAWNFEKDRGYLVKYDDTDTRLVRFDQVSYPWFETYFEWEKAPEGDRLHLRNLKQLPPWTGALDTTDYYYRLYPIEPSMYPVFLDFVLAQGGWTKEHILNDKYHEYTGRCLRIGTAGRELDLIFKESEQQISLSRHHYEDTSPEILGLLEKIARNFNAELAAGQHQAHFGRIRSETKKIRGGK
jgi:hypothetical protein